ncbi:MAG: type II toxin-antitoxin system YafQ family toxin [bacterium]|nr:type II toxin-antitoxin system YafQ family toxin [bacterium]
MIFNLKNTKYNVQYTSHFKKDFKKILKQGRDINKFLEVLSVIANGEKLNLKYKNHKLVDDKFFKNCNECHIMPDWLLVYKYQDDDLVLLLIATGSHSDLFNK